MVVVSGWRWCHKCGHRVAGHEAPVGQAPAAGPGQRPASSGSEMALATRVIPAWGWVLLGGLVVVAAVSCAADLRLAPGSRARALWSATQVGVGLVSLLLAGLFVSTRLGWQRDHMGLADLLMPDRLWPKAFKCLPHTRWHVCAGAWSVALMLCGLVWVGGWTYWLPTRPPPRVEKGGVGRFAPGNVAAKAEDNAPAEEDPDATKVPPPDPDAGKEPEPKKSVSRCVIVGYTVKDGQLAELLVATVTGTEMRYAGTVPVGKDPTVREDLLTRFAALKAAAPVFPDLDIRAVWLQPLLNCEVESIDSEDWRLKDPQFKGLVFPKDPQPVRLPAAGGPPATATPPAKDGGKGKDDIKSKGAGKSKDASKAGAGLKSSAAVSKPPAP
jgi:hypothetical protein